MASLVVGPILVPGGSPAGHEAAGGCGPAPTSGIQHSGGMHPQPGPGGAVRPYAVPRRTRRRGAAGRGAAGLAAWGRRRAGTACACCAR